MKPVKTTLTKVQNEYFKTVIHMVLNGLAFVAALAWNEAIKSLINRYIEPGQGIISHLVYAVLVTSLVVVVTVTLGGTAKKWKIE